jgi:hypothetical protein
MRNIKIIYFASVLSVTALFNPSALAQCVQGDLTGKWSFYFNLFSPQVFSWARCRVVFIEGDVIDTSKLLCKDPQGRIINLTGTLSLSVTTACKVTGQLGDATFVDVRLNLDKNTLFGVGTVGTDTLFSLSGVRR